MRPERKRPSWTSRAGLALFGPFLLFLLAAPPASPAPHHAPSRSSSTTKTTTPKPTAASSELARIRFWTAPDHTRLVFDLTGPSGGEPRFRMADSLTFEVFLPGTRKSPAVTTEFVGDSLVADLFPAVSDSGCSVRIHLLKRTNPLGFVLAAGDGNPDRIVVDVPAPPNPDADRQLAQKVTALKASKELIVAIDAGHGGEDTGAIGYRQLQEADVTLAIAKRLKAQLDIMPGVSGFLTRTSDYFVPLRKRIDIARRYQADLFVSIHCNASRDHNATGTEIYFLSLTGATDEAARSLAEQENAADLVGGVSPAAGDDLLSILFDLRQNDTIRRSSELAEILIDQLGTDNRLQSRGVKQAGFVVLKAPEIPSVLVETAFITNPRESSMLRDSQFQSKFAEMLAQGIAAYRNQHIRASSN